MSSYRLRRLDCDLPEAVEDAKVETVNWGGTKERFLASVLGLVLFGCGEGPSSDGGPADSGTLLPDRRVLPPVDQPVDSGLAEGPVLTTVRPGQRVNRWRHAGYSARTFLFSDRGSFFWRASVPGSRLLGRI